MFVYDTLFSTISDKFFAEAIERNLGITIQRDIDEERRRLESVPKSEIITRLLRAEVINTCY